MHATELRPARIALPAACTAIAVALSGGCESSAPRPCGPCVTPPPATCIDDHELRTYALPGECEDAACSYVVNDVTCAQGCAGGRCLDTCVPKTCAALGAACGDASDGCGGTLSCGACEDPPAPSCVTPQRVRSYAPVGTCRAGQCEYPSSEAPCTEGCTDGDCQGCVPSWAEVRPCDCTPTACAGCDGMRLELDGCGSSRERPCHEDPSGCAGFCCSSACCDEEALCLEGKCCTPDCAGKCGGASDGCGGSCPAGCADGQWCDGQICRICGADDPAHCGSACLGCAAQGTNRACIAGQCGCSTAADCAAGASCAGTTCTGCTPDCAGKCGGAPDGCGGTCQAPCPAGEWCSAQQCTACTQHEHCGAAGAVCVDCTAQVTDRACVNRACGCTDAQAHCMPGQACQQQRCCTPTTCTAAGVACGQISDGCGGTLDCGGCPLPETCGGGGVANTCGLDPAPQEPFNFVVIMLDDLDLGSFNALLTAQKLPGIQTFLLDHGTRFSSGFVSNSSCCPSRASFFTGQYCHNHQVLSVGGSQGAYKAFSALREPDALPVWLHKAGYETGFMGKYLNGYSFGADPFPAGWSATSEVTQPCPTCKIPAGWDTWHAIQLGSGNGGRYAMAPYTADGQQLSYVLIQSTPAGPVARGSHVYQTDKLKQLAVDFIDNSGVKPFFLYVAPLAVHTETFIRNGQLVPSPATKSEYIARNGVRPAPRHAGTLQGQLPLPRTSAFNNVGSGRPYWFDTNGHWWGEELSATDIQELERNYHERLEAMLGVDELIAAIGTKLVEKQQYDRTVIVLVSDNGYQLGEHRTVNKQFPYEPSIRVPLVMRVPGTAAPSGISAPVLVQDLPATILDYAQGATAGSYPLDGRTLRPLLESQLVTWRRQILVEHWYARTGSPLPFWELPDYYAIRSWTGTGVAVNRVFAEYYDDFSGSFTGWSTGLELYDLTADVQENSNVVWNAGQDRAKLHLSRVLNLLRGCQGTGCRAAEDLAQATSATPCETVSAANVRAIYDAQGKPTGLRQHVISGGLMWTRTATPAGSWSTNWSVASLGQIWGEIGTSTPGVDPAAHPTVEHVDAFVIREIFDSSLMRTKMRQIVYKGSRYWWRDSQDASGTQWPTAWNLGTLAPAQAPWVTGPYAADIRPLYQTGQLAGFRQVFVDSDDGVSYTRDSDDAAGNTFTKAFTPMQTEIDEASALAIHPEFDAAGARVRMRQLAFIAGTLWSRASGDADGKSWPAFSQQALSTVWGGHAFHPPTTTACK